MPGLGGVRQSDLVDDVEEEHKHDDAGHDEGLVILESEEVEGDEGEQEDEGEDKNDHISLRIY